MILQVIARTEERENPLWLPTASYEIKGGFFGNVVFTNGHIVTPDGDTITV
jgi:predicted GH43/DUF377 family glycosyl hydrolase